MSQLERNGHRQRLRQKYIEHGIDCFAQDYEVLEFFLSFVVPRKDVKQLAYDLINKFGTLDAVLNATPNQIMQINGAGECVATAVSLVKDLVIRANKSQNESIKLLNRTDTAINFVKNQIGMSNVEQCIVITLSNDCQIINCHLITDGTINTAHIEPNKIVQCVIKDNASCVIIGHNHPNSSCTPSAADINFTIELLNILRKIQIKLIDHIIIGKDDALSLCTDVNYSMYFD